MSTKAFLPSSYSVPLVNSHSVLESNHIFELDIQRGLIVALRRMIYGLSTTSLLHKYTSDIFKTHRETNTIQ